jgi:hypothetical protein
MGMQLRVEQSAARMALPSHTAVLELSRNGSRITPEENRMTQTASDAIAPWGVR